MCATCDPACYPDTQLLQVAWILSFCMDVGALCGDVVQNNRHTKFALNLLGNRQLHRSETVLFR